MYPKLKLVLTPLLLIVVILLVTNPTYSDFTNFSAKYENANTANTEMYHKYVRVKEANYFIASTYTIQEYNITKEEDSNTRTVNMISSHKYIGVFSNFFILK